MNDVDTRQVTAICSECGVEHTEMYIDPIHEDFDLASSDIETLRPHVATYHGARCDHEGAKIYFLNHNTSAVEWW